MSTYFKFTSFLFIYLFIYTYNLSYNTGILYHNIQWEAPTPFPTTKYNMLSSGLQLREILHIYISLVL